MIEILLKYSSVYFFSMFKFILGPAAGAAAQLSIPETSTFTVMGMMTTVIIIVALGGKPLEWLSKKMGVEKKLNQGNNRIKKIWERFGIKGIAFLTPVVFTPVGGAIIAVMAGGSRVLILKYMFVSALFWGITFSILFERGAAVFGF